METFLLSMYLPDAIHLVMLVTGVLFLVKKIADMDRYHAVRVGLLTSLILGFIVYFFFAYVVTYEPCGCVCFDQASTNIY